MFQNKILIKLLFFGLGTLAFLACGVYSFTGASIPPDAKTFSVRQFPNNASLINPTLSQVFTDALKDQFSRQTSLTYVSGSGDLHFEGAITGYTTAPMSIGADDRPTQNRLTVTVRVTFINTFEPDNDFERTFARYYDYDSRRSLAEVEALAIDNITEALVEDIFNAAVVNW